MRSSEELEVTNKGDWDDRGSSHEYEQLMIRQRTEQMDSQKMTPISHMLRKSVQKKFHSLIDNEHSTAG